MNRQHLLGIVKYIVSIGLVLLVVYKVPMRAMLERARLVDIRWLLVAILCNFLLLWLQALRWKVLMPRSQASVGRLYAWCIIGAASALIMPSAVGGDTLKAILLGKEENAMGASVASTIMGRVFGLLALCCICLGGVLFWPPIRSLISPWKVAALAAFVLFGAGVLVFLSKGGFRPNWAGKRKILFSHITETVRSPSRLGAAAVLSILLQVLSILTSWILFFACGQRLPLAAASALFPIVMLGTMAPISIGGVGIRESLTVVLFRQFVGIPAAVSLTVNIVSYVAFLIIAVSGALCWAFLRPRNKAAQVSKEEIA